MNIPFHKFEELDAQAKKKAHIKACEYSLLAWEAFVQKGKNLSYRDSIVLMKHHINKCLPSNALKAVKNNTPNIEINELYLEPITALQDMDWEPPENIEYAYYSIYNLYKKYCEDEDIDDWLIINQCLSSAITEEKGYAIFQDMLSV